MSVPEVSDISEHERDTVLVTAVNGVLVSDATARLSDNSDAFLACFFDRIIPSCQVTGMVISMISSKNAKLDTEEHWSGFIWF